MKHKHAYEEAKVTGRTPEIEMHAYAAGEDFERENVGSGECRGRYGRIINR